MLKKGILKKSGHSSRHIYLFLIVFAFVSYGCPRSSEIIKDENEKTVHKENNNTDKLIGLCKNFENLNNAVRDNEIIKDSALSKIQRLILEIQLEYFKAGGISWPESLWVFPVQGYSIFDIGGKDGSGYQPTGYNYFDGNKHLGHPAHDIFIIDRDQDSKDDRTKKYVNIISLSGGVVVAVENEWDTLSNLRGGKYIWIFDTYSSSLFYYAHNHEIFVNSGQIIIPGDTIAIMGRTGLNAFKERSPTHLHFMQLKFDDNHFPRPFNPYQELLGAHSER